MNTKRIAIVDDDPNIRFFLEESLRSMGVEQFLFAEDGAQILDLAKKELPDLIIMDVGMPSMNGLTTLRHLKEAPETKEIPVMIISGRGNFSHLTELGPNGAAAVLPKPFSHRQLVSESMRLLSAACPAA